jgi:hypothetical protein
MHTLLHLSACALLKQSSNQPLLRHLGSQQQHNPAVRVHAAAHNNSAAQS